MKVCFVHNEHRREREVANAFCAGVLAGGDTCEKQLKTFKLITDAQVVCMVGVKSVKLFTQARKAGKDVIFLDKGYFRHRGTTRDWEYWRVAVNDHHPTGYVSRARHLSTRWDIISGRLGVSPAPWRSGGSHILYAGSSAKYHTFAGLPEPTEYAKGVIKDLAQYSDRLIVYRPKPSWHEAVPMAGSTYSPREESIETALAGAWCLVTSGSNAAFDAVIRGIPAIVLGNSIAKSISSQDLSEVENPYLATDYERQQWLSNLSWCMFTQAEMSCGLAWKALRAQLGGAVIKESTLAQVACESMISPSVLKATRVSDKRKKRKEVNSKKKATKRRKKNAR